MDALQRRSATGEAARAAAGRPDQLAVGDRPPVREGRGVGDRVNPGHARIQHQIDVALRSEEHTSELQSLMRISYAVFCLKKNKETQYNNLQQQTHTISSQN